MVLLKLLLLRLSMVKKLFYFPIEMNLAAYRLARQNDIDIDKFFFDDGQY